MHVPAEHEAAEVAEGERAREEGGPRVAPQRRQARHVGRHHRQQRVGGAYGGEHGVGGAVANQAAGKVASRGVHGQPQQLGRGRKQLVGRVVERPGVGGPVRVAEAAPEGEEAREEPRELGREGPQRGRRDEQHDGGQGGEPGHEAGRARVPQITCAEEEGGREGGGEQGGKKKACRREMRS